MYYISTHQLTYTYTNPLEILFQEPEPEPEKKVIEKPKLRPKPAPPPPAPPKEDVKEKMFQLKGIKCHSQVLLICFRLLFSQPKHCL